MTWKPLARTIRHVHHETDNTFYTFSKEHKPSLTVDSGAKVSFDNTHAGFVNLTRDSTTADAAALDIQSPKDLENLIGQLYVNGPVYVNGAESGGILKVEILELQTGSWGWTAVIPGMGLLQDEIPGPHIMTFDLPESQDDAEFKPGIQIPSEGEQFALYPRNDIAGNFDCRYLGQGSTLFLPVNVPGALFAVGDAHPCQGGGEICCTALETTMRSQMRLSVVKQMVSVASKGEHGALITGTDRDTVVKQAVREIMRWLEEEKGLTQVEGYMLFSIVGNLKMMHEIGLGVYTVSSSIPLGIFVD
ncbi:hypothetical protein V8C34DRAFT_326745 [Trichoderma compactum]